MPELRVCALYPDLMNIYADRGNLFMLERRSRWRGFEFELTSASLGERLDPDGADIYYIGGGQDRDQKLCAHDLAEVKREGLHAAAARGAVILAVCGGYQLLGHSYQLGEETLAGVGLVDVKTVRADGRRLIGNVAIEVEFDPGEIVGVFAGFENHGGRTYLGRGPSPRAGPEGPRQQRTRRPGGSPRGPPDRHLPARSAAAQERLVRRLADRNRAGPALAAGTAVRRAGERRPR